MNAAPIECLPHPCQPEAETVAHCLGTLNGVLDWSAAARDARPWVEAARTARTPFWAMDRLMKEYPISSSEGLALMRLAEALLRVPDADTAMRLTADQLSRADFHTAGDGAMARLSASALQLARHLLPDHAEASDGGLLARLGGRTITAAAVRAVQLLGRQFVLGEDMAQALAHAQPMRAAQGTLRFSFDCLGEGARTDQDAQAHLAHYHDAIDSIAATADPQRDVADNDGISVKLSALHPRYEWSQADRVLAELVPRLWSLVDRAARVGVGLTLDAEESDRLELQLMVLHAVAERVAQQHPRWGGLGLAVQAYQTRAPALVAHLTALARRLGIRLMVRLVKGAYWDSEIKRAQELGLPGYPVFTHKHHTDVCYLACARALLAARDCLYPQFATHNAATIAALVAMARRVAPERDADGGYELQRLHGMGESVYQQVLRDPLLRCRVYAPVGRHRDLLAYLVRRLLENGANSSFVHQLADDRLPVDELLVSPLRLSPRPGLALPPELYQPERRNSAGIDLSVAAERARLLAALQRLRATPDALHVRENQAAQAPAALARAQAAFAAWDQRPVAERAAMLCAAADAMEQALPEWCARLVHEAHKTWPDAVAEVREAVDFLRYYAAQAPVLMQPKALPGPTGERNELRLRGRGCWVCISPWNFPLAIFIGQVAAALVTGNCVVAKPAEQTPAVARDAVALLHACGVPADVLQLLHGPGETVGAALVGQPQVVGVAFTGSTAVARAIQRQLAAGEGPIAALIAETGGINALIADSSALPEQVVDAVLHSAFRSAGQRCSALRLLCLHEAVADDVLHMLHGAVRELRVGPAQDFASDLGPLIDAAAADAVRAGLRATQALYAQPDIIAAGAPDAPTYVAPTILPVPEGHWPQQEIFGPVLQVMRWRGDPLALVDQINRLGAVGAAGGYALTLGIHTRIDHRAEAMARHARAGNVYVNRNIVGAVVGTQPFGGEGLSGTGPKAGGPHYLLRFCSEQTFTVNTAAAGGNAALLGGAP